MTGGGAGLCCTMMGAGATGDMITWGAGELTTNVEATGDPDITTVRPERPYDFVLYVGVYPFSPRLTLNFILPLANLSHSWRPQAAWCLLSPQPGPRHDKQHQS